MVIGSRDIKQHYLVLKTTELKTVSKQTCMRVFECLLFVNKQRVVVCSQKPTNVILGQDDEEWKESGGHC